MREYLMMEPA